MMIKSKKFLSIFCAGILGLSLSACGTTGTADNAEKQASSADSAIVNEKDSTNVAENSQDLSSSSSDENAVADMGDTDDVDSGNTGANGNIDNDILVAYFSRTGNTAPLAEYAAEILDADIYEIKAVDEYTDEDIDYTDETSRTSIEQNDTSVRPEIDGTVEDMDQYETVVLAYPIWWGQAPRILDTFVESYDFSGKTVTAFCTSGSSDIGDSDDRLMELAGDGVNWIQGKRFAAGIGKDEIESWLQEIGLMD